ncbi:hypothetical protein ADEAN_000795700 [Angomonas deanei]|uniref:Uncharacterized protein n=1 Tax=Angomonas deanei TaxID=59799 RepID=A0A7G2CLY2_9TRYP|nr:hypothetical protein ADEAN_000795700 [Angomonas deanei]
MSTENYASVYEEEPQSEAAFYIDEDNDNDASTSEANVKVIAGGSTHDEETEERYPKETSEPPYEEGESEDPFAVIQPTPPEEEEEAPEPSEAPPAPTLEQTPPYVTPKKSSTTVPSESSHITANNNNNTNNTNTISRGNTEEFNRPDSKRRSVSSLSPSALNSAKNTNYHSNNAEVLRRQSVLSNAQARRGSSPFSATTPNRRASRLTVAESQAMELMTYNDMKRAEVKEQSELIEMEETQIKVEKELKKEIQAYERQMTRALQQEEERHAKAIAKL